MLRRTASLVGLAVARGRERGWRLAAGGRRRGGRSPIEGDERVLSKTIAKYRTRRTCDIFEKGHFVTLKTRYWDEYDVLFKELVADRSSITRFEGRERSGEPKEVWVPRESCVTQLKTGSYTKLTRTELKLDVTRRDKDFSQRKLTASR